MLLTTVVEAKPFVTAILAGQLGNQMFQIAAAVSLALDNDAIATFPDLKTKNSYGSPQTITPYFFHLIPTNLDISKKNF